MDRKLRDLIGGLSGIQTKGRADQPIEGLAYDSRQTFPGDLFFCIRGYKEDGHRYAPQALESGAVGLVAEEDLSDLIDPKKQVFLQVPDSRAAMAQMAHAFYGRPSSQLRVVGVTGTNGKTSTTYLLREIFKAAGRQVGLMGTVQNLIGEDTLEAVRTTPESIDLQRLMYRMVQEGVEDLVMEASSHALALKRVEATQFTAAIFTNITQDHLDFHGTFEDYFAAKTSLFTGLGPKAVAIINLDDPRGEELAEMVSCRVVTYGRAGMVRALDPQVTVRQIQYTLQTPDGSQPVSLSLSGNFNVANSLAAATCAWALGTPLATIAQGLEGAKGVPGRFELIEEGQEFGVVVDYAHTPDGLENLLQTAVKVAEGRVLVVFGCGGDRDRGKRPLMGEIAGQLADVVYITSDNPRSEDPLSICLEVQAGLDRSGRRGRLIVDRREAIAQALADAGPQDLVVIAGKGHESTQTFKDKTIHFDDRQVAREILREMSEEER